MKQSVKERALKKAAAKIEGRDDHANPADADNSRSELPPPNDVTCFYDTRAKSFWTMNGKGEWFELTQANLKLHLRSHGYSLQRWHANGLNFCEQKILDIAHNFGVHYAGPVAGFKPGLYEVGTDQVLVTRGPKMIQPKKGKWPTLRKLFTELLGPQAVYFYAWLKHARTSLAEGTPFRPGQALAIAGPSGSGKSLTQDLITPILGGRAACPYRAMMGRTEFNADLIAAEHLKIEDKVAGKDQRSRLEFAAALKSFVANKTQSNHKKTVDANMLTPFWRLSITLNDQPENMLVLPSLTDDIADKIILLRASPATMPYGDDDFAGYKRYWADLLAELPAFLFHLDRWSIPKNLQHVRWGVKAYQDPELVESIRSLAPERKLWEYICGSSHVFSDWQAMWEGTASELQGLLVKSHGAATIEKLLSWSTSCGVYLSRLSEQMPDHVSVHKKSNAVTRYTIRKE